MRFERLDILRYGALTDRVLAFRPDAKLHVIYGPNEAGKSSALQAISDLLFGFQHSTEYDFLHDSKSLRIGAKVQSKTGASLDFRRRKGLKTTLLSPDDKETALPDDALAPFLGNLSRDVFERAFGLDSQRLRLGAATMLRSGGEIGSLLFSAASGLTGLSRLRQSLEGEAEGIFAQRRSKDRSFYQALDRYKDASKAERDNELLAGHWKKLIAEAADIEAAVAALRAERYDTKQALDRLQLLKVLQPLILEIDAEMAALQTFADLPDMSEAFEATLLEAVSARNAADDALRLAEAQKARLIEELDAAHVDTGALDAFAAIMAFHADKGSYLKMRQDLSGVKREVEEFELRLGQFARRLGLEGGAEELERLQPADTVLARLRSLVDQGRELRRNDQDIHRRLEEERGQLQRLESGETSGRLIDPKPYLDQLTALQPDIAALERLDAQKIKVERAAREIEEGAARLSPGIDDLDRLLASPLPDLTTLNDHRRKLDGLDATAREASTNLAALAAERDGLARDRAALEQGGALVTRDRIATARAARDSLLRNFASKVPPHGDILATLDEAIGEADRLADLALADAERIARHAQLTTRLADMDRRIEQARAASDLAVQALGAARIGFQGLFEAAGVAAAAPEHMIEWRRSVDALSARRDALHVAKDDLSLLEAQEQRLLPALRALADATGLPGADVLPPLASGRALARHVAELSSRWMESRSTEGKRISIIEGIAKLEEREQILRTEAERWQGDFAEAVATAQLGEGLSVDMAEAALDVWKDVPQVIFERENRRRRVRGMLRDIAAFEDGVRALAAEVDSALAALSVDAAVDVLHRRAMAADAGRQRRLELADAVEQSDVRLSHRARDAAEAAAILGQQVEALPDATDISALLRRLGERRGLQARLAAARNRFQHQAQGLQEIDARALTESFDRVTADLDIDRLEAQDAAQVARYGELMAQSADNSRRRELLETGASAEYAVFEKLAAEQDAKELARQWVVLKLAAHMLGTSMGAYRERQTDPVMVRAGELFSALTGDRFARLVQDYDGNDELQLLAERTGGGRVPLTGLSEGTGDQLYLALRLAFLDDYAARNEPAPLIVDDIFQTFDDERTAAGIRTLADTSDRFQTILFTHERSVVDIAAKEIGSALDLIEL